MTKAEVQQLKNRSPALDGVRGLAIIGVLLTHIAFYFGSPSGFRLRLAPLVFGWAGVDLFFGLSGFLITGILLKTRTAKNRGSSFYARRVLRIAPIYYLTLITVFSAAVFLPWINEQLPNPGWDRASYFFYVQNMPQLWGTQHMPATNIIGHFWSLAVEEQFYLIWPAVVWLVPERYLLRLCPIALAASFALRCSIVYTRGTEWWWMIWTPTRGAEALIAGSLLAILTVRFVRIPRFVLAGCGTVGLALLSVVAVLDPREFVDALYFHGPYMYTIGYTGINLVSVALIGSTQYAVPVLMPVLRSAVLRNFGRYSYGIYVYHIPVITCLTYYGSLWTGRSPFDLPFPIAVAASVTVISVSIFVAWVSFRFIESPMLSLKDRFTPTYIDRRPGGSFAHANAGADQLEGSCDIAAKGTGPR